MRKYGRENKEIQKAKTPKYCGHSYETAAYLGGLGCGLRGESGYADCDTRNCPNLTRRDFEDEDGFDVFSAMIDCVCRLEGLVVCPYCKRKKGYEEHYDWCVLGAVLEECGTFFERDCGDDFNLQDDRYRLFFGLFERERKV